MLPKFLASFGVKRGNPFLHVRPVAEVPHDVQLAISDHGSGLAREISNPEGFFGGNVVGQSFF